MKNSPILIVCVTAALLILAVLALGQTVLIHSFVRIEDDAIAQSIAQVRKAVQADLKQLETSARDYAQWDDAYHFMETGERKYINSNYQKETLDGLQVDLVLITDREGRDVYSAERRDDTPTTLSPAPESLLNQFKRALGPLDRAGRLPQMQRLLRLPSGLLAFTVKPILRTDLSGPALGQLVWARYLREDEVSRFRETSQLPVDLIHIEANADLSMLPKEVQDWIVSSPKGTANLALPRSEQVMGGYALLKDIHDHPVAVLVTSMPREVLMFGKRTTQTLTGILIGLILAFLIVVLSLFTRLTRIWKEREASDRRYRTVVSHLDESIVLAEEGSRRIVEANAALLRRLGWENAEILECKVDDIFVGLNSDENDTNAAQCQMRARDGHTIDVEVTRCKLVLDGRLLLCLVARDISARKRAELQLLENQRKLAHLAHHDALTGLPNRLYLQSRLPKLLSRVTRTEKSAALLYIDVDHFKNINDSRGHGSGDTLLRLVAQRLRKAVAARDLVVRMGGDEFVVVATDLAGRVEVEALAKRVMTSLAAPIEIDGATFSITTSVGVSLYPDDGLDLEVLLKHADIALYQAKDRGRNNFQMFAADMNVRLMERVALEQALRRAIGTEQLFVEYQPIVDIHTGTPTSLEALVRWQHPDLGLVPPNRFIPVAEQSAAIVDLGEHVLRQVCRQIAEWSREGVPLIPVCINVSPKQFERSRLQDVVAALTREYAIDPGLLSFEITEGAVMHDIEQHLGTLHALRRLGSRIAVDDFGTGYSSLSYLKHLPIDALKIDRAFVRDMATDDNDAAIVTAIIGMARSLSLRTVAEGVETLDQLERLRGLGCDSAQGFYFSKPMPVKACRTLLEQLGSAQAAARKEDTIQRRALRLVSGR